MNSMKQTGCIHVVPSGLCTPLYKHSMGSRPWLYHFVLSGLSTAATRRHVVAMGVSPWSMEPHIYEVLKGVQTFHGLAPWLYHFVLSGLKRISDGL